MKSAFANLAEPATIKPCAEQRILETIRSDWSMDRDSIRDREHGLHRF
jgi:hypothetical protein